MVRTKTNQPQHHKTHAVPISPLLKVARACKPFNSNKCGLAFVNHCAHGEMESSH
jgi:hypothetical protein